SPRARTSHDGPLRTSRPSRTRLTTDPAKSSSGRPLPRCSKNNYAHSTNPVLHRPIEPKQFRSRKFVHALNRHHLIGSMGQVGAAGDNAAMESFFSLLQKNVLDRKRWR